MANTWNQSGTTWSTGRWGTTDPIVAGWGAKSYNEPGTTWNNLTDQQVNLTSPIVQVLSSRNCLCTNFTERYLSVT